MPMPLDTPTRLAALAAAAKAWQDPEFEPREKAVRATLAAPNRFTEEAIAFAVNHHMHQLGSPTKLRTWQGDARSTAVRVGLIPEGAVPLDGVRALAAAWLSGHQPVVRLPVSSPYLLRAFAETVQAEGGPPSRFAVDDVHALTQSEALVLVGRAEVVRAWHVLAAEAAIAPERIHARTRRFTIAVIDGTEDFDTRIRLAEDILLHEGLGEANVVLLWAPGDLDADPFFEALSGFRQIMPAHADTEGVLEMPRAFLKAAKQPYAWGDGVLVSRGDPDVQAPGHLRWVVFDAPEHVVSWAIAHRDRLGGVVATGAVAKRLGIPDDLRVEPGDAHRPRLGTPSDRALMAFLNGL
ncbi:MAG: hypothetical protein AAF624_03060 [Bacteroidota bacterium]